MESTPCYLQSQVVSACQSFRHVAPFFFWQKYRFCLFGFLIQKGVWPYRYAYDIPLVTLILNIYGFVGLTSSVNRGFRDRQIIRTL